MSDGADETSDRDQTARRVSHRIDPFSPRPDAAAALNKVHTFGHPELIGETLDARRLSPSNASELLVLVRKRQGNVLERDENLLYQRLVGRAAGDEELFERKRTEAEIGEAVAECRQAERRLPQAESIVAAVFGDLALFDLLRPRPREHVVRRDDFGRAIPAHQGEFATARILELEDIGILFVLLGLIVESGGEIEITDVAGMARLPDRELPHVPNLADRLYHLRGNGYLNIRVESGTAYVSCGPQVRELCRRWGLALLPT